MHLLKIRQTQLLKHIYSFKFYKEVALNRKYLEKDSNGFIVSNPIKLALFLILSPNKLVY